MDNLLSLNHTSSSSKRLGCIEAYRGFLDRKTPVESLALKPGELVEVKSFDEIRYMLNKENKNRGLG